MTFTRAVYLTGLVTVMYVSAFAIMFWILMPLQVELVSQYLSFGRATSLVILPHGVRVVAAWFFRWKAIPLLVPGVIFEALVLERTMGLTSGGVAVMVMGFAVNSVAAFEVFRAFGCDVYATPNKPANWRMVLLVGMLAALINASFLIHVDFGFTTSAFSWWLAANAFIGGTLGLVVWLLLARLVLRILFPLTARYVDTSRRSR